MQKKIVFLAAFLTAGITGDAGAEGDAVRGEKVYNRCIACHSLERNRTGPKHCSIIGRKAGSVEGFTRYTDAMKQADIVWTKEVLSEFLAAPRKMVPGTQMFLKVPKLEDREDLIAYFEKASADPEICPQN